MKAGLLSLVVVVVVLQSLTFATGCLARQETTAESGQITFPSRDGVTITARLYLVGDAAGQADRSRPLIVLCHQAGWSRGEYQEIAPRLNELGFHCLAIDQRSGGAVNGVRNETAIQARAAGKPTNFADAEQDILAALEHVREKKYSDGKIILWGSSYSSALALRIAGEYPDQVDGVLAFAPGEYFQRFGKPADWIARSAKKIQVPTLITSAKNEYENWKAIYEAIPEEFRVKFVPETAGNHGSRALWKRFADSPAYWRATREFLEPFRVSGDAAGEARQDPQPDIRQVAGIEGLPVRIAFGSCSSQDKPQPVLETIVARRPDLFIYLGDNIYGDTRDMAVLKKKYGTLGAKPEFQKLRRNVPVLSIWDDHDYGWNDAGKEYEFKAESREIFLDFWQVPPDSPRRQHAGIYGSHRFEADGKSLQIILLDTRTFRDPLKTNPKPLPEDSPLKNQYQPDPDPDKTLLGAAQWDWLRKELARPADLRILCSSIQFGHEYNGWESWTNLPAERDRMVRLIRETGAGGVLFVSGDVHWGEISKRHEDAPYPLYDVTASGLTEEWYNVEPNRFRVGEAVRENHFGMIEIDWQDEIAIRLQIVDVAGKVRTQHEITVAEISPDP